MNNLGIKSQFKMETKIENDWCVKRSLKIDLLSYLKNGRRSGEIAYNSFVQLTKLFIFEFRISNRQKKTTGLNSEVCLSIAGNEKSTTTGRKEKLLCKSRRMASNLPFLIRNFNKAKFNFRFWYFVIIKFNDKIAKMSCSMSKTFNFYFIQ